MRPPKPGAPAGEPREGVGQPSAPPFEAGRDLVIVFSQRRRMEPDPKEALSFVNGVLEKP
jgi:hypothetical protein